MQCLHHHDYCSLHWHKGVLTDKTIIATLRHVGENRGPILDWVRTRLAGNAEGTFNEYVMIDSTHVTTTSNLLYINAPGYNPTKNFDAQELYEKYKQRNEIEVMFDSYKNFLKADRMYMQDRIVLEGWLMANFLAMIAYYKLYQKLVAAKQLSKYSPKDIIEISKSISSININGKWYTTETTKKTKDLFKKLKIDYLMERS